MSRFNLPQSWLGNMPNLKKLPLGIKKRQAEPDEWDRTLVAFKSPYQLKDLCVDQSTVSLNPAMDNRVSREQFKIRLATNEDRRKSASMLVEKMYNWRGYETSEMGRDPNKITLVAYQEDKVVGTLTLGLDTPDGMVVDQLYKKEADDLRAQGRVLCDITRLAVDQEIRSKSVLAALFHLSFIYGRNIHHATDFLIEVNPRHVLFYERMLGFAPIGEEKVCPRVNAPAVLLRLDLAYADAQIVQYGGAGSAVPGVKSIYPYFFSREDELGITQRLLRGE